MDFSMVIPNLEQVGLGAGLFLCAYIANMGLGAWKNVSIEGYAFDWKLILQSVVKFIIMTVSLGLLSCVVSIVPEYATFIGITIEPETLQTISGVAITGAFLTATIRYIVDAISKVKTILE